MKGGMNLNIEPSREVATSMIVSGSTVAVVGGILILTKTWAFSAMLAFGLVVTILGIVIGTRSSVTRQEPDEQPPTDI